MHLFELVGLVSVLGAIDQGRLTSFSLVDKEKSKIMLYGCAPESWLSLPPVIFTTSSLTIQLPLTDVESSKLQHINSENSKGVLVVPSSSTVVFFGSEFKFELAMNDADEHLNELIRLLLKRHSHYEMSALKDTRVLIHQSVLEKFA